ncbi:MAG: ferredoxin [Gemmatimonadaceae bacterium]
MTPDADDLLVHGLRVRIDRTLCVGFGDCITEAPDAFVLDEEGVAVFLHPDRVTREVLLHACDECPVDAITVWDDGENQIIPS